MKYRVYYYDKSGDYTSCWVNATSAEDAENRVLEEYWDVKEIQSVTPLH